MKSLPREVFLAVALLSLDIALGLVSMAIFDAKPVQLFGYSFLAFITWKIATGSNRARVFIVATSILAVPLGIFALLKIPMPQLMALIMGGQLALRAIAAVVLHLSAKDAFFTKKV